METTQHYKIIETWLSQRLTDIDLGIGEDPTTNEVLRIKAALDNDRLTADQVMTVIYNMFNFLYHDFELTSDNDSRAIKRFLDGFMAAVKDDFSAKVKTQKDAIAMDLSQED